MQALLYPAYGELEVRDVPEPSPGPGEVLVRVGACGICGSETGSFAARSTRRVPPVIMGHEFAGTVAALGEGVTGLRVGERVVVNSLVHCGACDLCRRGLTHLCRQRQVFGMHRPGAFAELVAAPAGIVYPMPESMTAVLGALVEPLANGVHVIRLAQGNPMERVVVLGAGPIGLMCLQAALQLGARQVAVSEVNAGRREVALALGAATAWDPRDGGLVAGSAAFTDGQGADLVVDAVGSAQTKRDAVTLARPGGDIVWIGLHGDEVTFNSFDLILPERRLSGSYGAADADIRTAIDWFSEGKIRTDPWVETVPLSRGAEAFFGLLRQESDAVKVVLEPGR
jgi:threonine dehydrogenase-like Zn-dependent dehydrogenase